MAAEEDLIRIERHASLDARSAPAPAPDAAAAAEQAEKCQTHPKRRTNTTHTYPPAGHSDTKYDPLAVRAAKYAFKRYVVDPRARIDEAIREFHSRRSYRLRRACRRGVRISRAERSREDLDDADDRVRVACQRRRASGAEYESAHSMPAGSRRGSGVVPQQDNLDTEITVRENLLMYARYFDIPRHVAQKRADELLEFVELTDRAGAQVESLSGGMKRRLTIARALVNEPESDSARRADDRARSAGASRRVGAVVSVEAPRRDPAADHALHGRGRAPVRSAGRHGQGDESSPKARRAS